MTVCKQEDKVLGDKLETQSSEKDTYAIDALADWEVFLDGIPAVPMIDLTRAYRGKVFWTEKTV